MTNSPLFHSERDGDVLFVTFGRNVPTFSDSQLLGEFQALVAAHRKPGFAHVVIDFGQMPYFGSGMLEAILLAGNAIHPAGGKLALCNVSSVSQEGLQVSHFNTLWPVCKDRSEALRVVRGEQSV